MQNKYMVLTIMVLVVVGGYFFLQAKKSPSTPSTTIEQSILPTSSSSPKSKETILETIPTLTKPMVWTNQVEGTLMDAAGDGVVGTLITSKVTTKEDNKFAGLLVSDSLLITQYGWKEDPSGMASGMGETISTYIKNNQKLIIRYKGGTYQVLLSK